MARTKNTAVSNKAPSMDEIQKVYNETVFAKNSEIYKQLKDVTKSSAKSIATIDKETLKGYFRNLQSN